MDARTQEEPFTLSLNVIDTQVTFLILKFQL